MYPTFPIPAMGGARGSLPAHMPTFPPTHNVGQGDHAQIMDLGQETLGDPAKG